MGVCDVEGREMAVEESAVEVEAEGEPGAVEAYFAFESEAG